jgi:hypothetical protein
VPAFDPAAASSTPPHPGKIELTLPPGLPGQSVAEATSCVAIDIPSVAPLGCAPILRAVKDVNLPSHPGEEKT